jgi:hypothetical protein
MHATNPKKESEPTKYWLSTLPVATSLKSLVKIAKHRWIIERDYAELKQELGLGHYEGRGWRGFHHHAVLCIAAYGFLVSERNRFFPPRVPAMLDYQPPPHRRTSGRAARRVRPERHNPNSIATLRTMIARLLLTQSSPVFPRDSSIASRSLLPARHSALLAPKDTNRFIRIRRRRRNRSWMGFYLLL